MPPAVLAAKAYWGKRLSAKMIAATAVELRARRASRPLVLKDGIALFMESPREIFKKWKAQ
jgi:hypothetical protein